MILRKIDDLADSLILSASRKSWLLYGLVILLCLCLFLPGLFDMPPMDRDETRFAQATKQMLETQNYVDIRLGEETRYKKPVGIYWLQAISVHIFGSETSWNEIGSYRIPSVIGGILAVLAVIAMTRRLFGREAAVIAGFLAPLPILVSIEAHLAKSDSVMVACTALSVYVLACLWRLNEMDHSFKFKTRHFIIFWVALAVGILVKGVNLAVVIPAILTLSVIKKDIKWFAPLKPHYGLLIVAAIVLPWFIMIQHLSAGQFLQDSAGSDLWHKVISAVESHGAPPLTHLLAHFGIFWPVSLLSPFAIWFAWKNKELNDGYVFILATLIPAWVLFELMPTKLPHYTYPVYGLILSAIAGMCTQFVHESYDILKGKLFYVFSGIYLIVSIAIAIALPAALYLFEHQIDLITVGLSILSVIFAVIAVLQLRDGLIHGIILVLMLQALCLLPNGFGRIMSQMNSLNLATQMHRAVESSDCSNNAVFVTGYNEPSVLFKVGTNVNFLSMQEITDIYAKATPCSLFFIASEQDKTYGETDFERTYTDVQPIRILKGFKINGGDNMIIKMYKR